MGEEKIKGTNKVAVGDRDRVRILVPWEVLTRY
jgi:hypothetical protein